MPRNGKRRFIDPKKSVTFEVVPRNQVDPLAADESAPKNVLVEKKTKQIIEADYHDPHHFSKRERLEEQQKFGVYFDDDYNYLQHLRDVRVVGTMEEIVRVDKSGLQVKIKGEGTAKTNDQDGSETGNSDRPRLLLPSSVFPSHVEERVGHLNKGLNHVGLRLDWDPDVMAALDDSVDADELEDDFVAMASGGIDAIEDLGAGDEEPTAQRFYFTDEKGGSPSFVRETSSHSDDNSSYMQDSSDDENNSEIDDNISMLQSHCKFGREETRSKFTDYSLSSSVMTRTGGLKSLDEQFEEMFDKEYDECDIGALDGEGIEGRIPVKSAIVEKLVDGYEKEVDLQSGNIDASIGHVDDEVKSRVLQSINRRASTEEIKLIDNDNEQKEANWDCESILSTYSNTYNRPKIIDFNKKDSAVVLGSLGFPVEGPKLLKKSLKQLDAGFIDSESYAKSVCSRASHAGMIRPKDESTEDRRKRKLQVKEFRRERRMEKKQSKTAFKTEEIRQKVQDMSIQNNFKGLKIY